MNDNRLAAVLALALAIPAMIWAFRDFREGRARLMLRSRRSRHEILRETDPAKFRRYTAINAILCAIVVVFAVLLFFKPVE